MSSRDIGKRTPTAVYVHRDAFDKLDAKHKQLAAWAVKTSGAGDGWDVAKFHHDGSVSLLAYPGFYSEKHPRLARSWYVSPSGRVRRMEFTGRARPPILHRKWLMVGTTHR